MTTSNSSETVLVVDNHVVVIAVDSHDAPTSLELTIHLDGKRLQTLEEPGWRVPRYGTADLNFYFWSARRVVIVPLDLPRNLKRLETDEDIILVFRRPGAWLVVCETSLRLLVGEVEVSRLEYPEVLVEAIIEFDQVILRDASGATRRAAVTARGLNPIA